MRYLLTVAIGLLWLPLLTNAQKANPYESIGKKTAIVTLSNGRYQETFDDDTLQRIGSVIIDRRTRKVVQMLDADSISKEASDNSTSSRWYSIDPLAEKYYSHSPYAYCANNPVLFKDPDGMRIVVSGGESMAAVNELRASVKPELSLSQNGDGVLSYTQTDANVSLSANAQQLVNAIDDKNITVNILAENTTKNSQGDIMVGGAFGGNTVTQEQREITNPLMPSIVIGQETVTTVSTKQEINPLVLGAADNYYGTSGSLTLHEATESYQGALISLQRGTSAASSSIDDGPNSVYQRAHNAATPQNMAITRYIYDAQGNKLSSPYTGATKVEYSVQQGDRPPAVIMTVN